MSLTAEAATIVAVPIEVVYRAASDLAHYPLFMVGARSVTPVDDAAATFRWVTRPGLRSHTCDVEILERVPDQRVSWRSRPRGANDGTFQLEPLGDQTHVTLQWACEHLGVPPDLAASQSLANFKRALETGQRQRRPPDPLRITLLVAVSAALVAAGIGIRSRSEWQVRRRTEA